jgi:hypothetical protein
MKKVLLLLGGMLFGADIAVAAVFLDQTTTTIGSGNTLRAYRVPTTTTAGAVKYYDITFAFTQDATGKPVLAASYPVITLSPTLLAGSFKAGKYKDGQGNYYTVGGPGSAGGGRTSWSVLLTKKSTSCSSCALSGSWTTGSIAGHPIEATLKAQTITSTAFSWGTVTADYYVFLGYCNGRAVGAAQAGNVLSLNGYCSGTAQQTNVLTLNLCTAANPCP